MSSVKPAWRGMISPTTNAPKIGAMPICWATKAASSTETKIPATHSGGMCPSSS